MKYFFDSSALIKKYIREDGSDVVIELIDACDTIYLSAVTLLECSSAIRRLFMDKKINQNEYEKIKNEILHNFKHYSIIVFSKKIETKSLKMIDKYSLKPLDSIQLASALAVKNEIESFVGCDEKLNKACNKETHTVFNPVKS